MPDIRQTHPLHIAAYNNHLYAAYMLLEYGAEVNRRDAYDATPLHWAAYQGDIDMVCLLLCYGADVHITENVRQTRPGNLARMHPKSLVDHMLNTVVPAVQQHHVQDIHKESL